MEAPFNTLWSLESAVQYRSFPSPKQATFAQQEGSHPILISAPHGAAHHRNGSLKPEEEFTSGLARYLAKQTNCHAIFALFKDRYDPNWDQEHLYKKKIKEIIDAHQIRFVIDLHGMSNRYGMGIAIGTMNGRSCPDHGNFLETTLMRSGFQKLLSSELEPRRSAKESIQFQHWSTFTSNHPKFTGGVVSHTITRFAHEELRIPAVQIELASINRIVMREAHGPWPVYRGSPEGIQHTIAALMRFIQQI